MEPETIAGHRFSEGRARFNRAAVIFFLLSGLTGSIYAYLYDQAISSGVPVSIYESHDPNVLSLNGKHARVEPEVYGRIKTYGHITVVLFVAGFALQFFLLVLNARLPASTAPDPLDELGPIRIAGDGVAHAGGMQSPIVLPRSRIESLELQYTPGLEKPIGGGLCGAFFLLLGLPLAVIGVTRIQDFETFAAFCFFSLLAGTGVWIIWLAIRKRYVLVAYTSNGRSRMIFPRGATRADVIHFVTDAARRHGYVFDFGRGLVG
jgi:hypothetical protein